MKGHVPASGTRPFLTLVAALLSMVGPFTIDSYLPSFPDIERDFGVGRGLLSQSLSAYLAAFAVSTLVWGPLSDRFGRRRVIHFSLLLFLSASIGCAYSPSFDAFLLLRVLQGVASSGGFIAARAMIRDAHDAKAAHRAMSQLTLVFALAPAIAPVLGGWLHDQFGWRSVFWFLALFSILLLVLMQFVRETLAFELRQSVHPLAVVRVYRRIAFNPRYLRLILTQSLGFAGLFLYIAGAPTVIYDFLGLGGQDFALQFIPIVAGLMLGSALSARLARRSPVSRTVSIGLTLSGAAAGANLALLALPEIDSLRVIAPLALYACGLAIAMPPLTVSALDCFPANRGSAASMQGFVQMLVNAGVAGLAVPLLHGSLSHFVLGQLSFLALAQLLWWLPRRQHRALGS